MGNSEKHAQKLILYGVLLFLLGLINGAVVQHFINPRIGLSAHLAAIQNGLVLIVFGLIWTKTQFSPKLSLVHYWSCLFSMFGIWISLLFAAIWGTSKSTPIAGKGFQAEAWKERTVEFLLVFSSVAITISTSHLLWRLFQKYKKAA